ncbi:MAG: serine/threonine protein kinase [Acidobacteria bacterium]|nr:MAG: serine/threonine protein kinase [Acidobacteriota bacterium]RPJ82760.1 MAG: serine/threonine protein kinase [Acidobacteriota bacterium]
MKWPSDGAVARLREVAAWPAFEGTRYTVVDEVGRGGMGTVYRARDESLGRTVAIKVSNAVGSPALEARLRREAQILARLEHPGIVPIHDVGRLWDGRLFYVMKHIAGKTLLAHLGPGASLAERLRIFERICEPVAFAHARGFIHRDLKPENVMIGPFGEVLVLDWGIAKVLARQDAQEEFGADDPTWPDPDGADDGVAAGREAGGAAGTGGCTGYGAGAVARHDAETGVEFGCTHPGTIVGTRGFMSPEQARGAVDCVDERTDVYGLGAILFTLLEGEAPPHEPLTTGARGLPGERAGRGRRRSRGVPKPLEAICAKAMAPDPAARYQSVAALSADVARFRTGDHVEAYREPWFESAARLAHKYRAAILLVLAYLAMRAIVAFMLSG